MVMLLNKALALTGRFGLHPSIAALSLKLSESWP
jgi:hypothetical protein